MASRFELEQFTHDHDFLGDSHEAHEKRTRYVVALTAAMMVVEIAARWMTGSRALLAKRLHAKRSRKGPPDCSGGPDFRMQIISADDFARREEEVDLDLRVLVAI